MWQNQCIDSTLSVAHWVLSAHWVLFIECQLFIECCFSPTIRYSYRVAIFVRERTQNSTGCSFHIRSISRESGKTSQRRIQINIDHHLWNPQRVKKDLFSVIMFDSTQTRSNGGVALWKCPMLERTPHTHTGAMADRKSEKERLQWSQPITQSRLFFRHLTILALALLSGVVPRPPKVRVS